MITIKVVGAGFSGLVTAYYLIKEGLPVRIVERSDRIGGMLRTIRTEHGLVETAANGIRNSARLEALCADIGVPLQEPKRNGRARYIYRSRPRRWPLDIAEVFRVLSGTAINVRRLRPQLFESVSEWGRRVVGAGATDYFLTPALGGIYAGDPKCLSASLILRQVPLSDELLQPPRTRPKRTGTVAPPEGMQQLIDNLYAYLKQAGVSFDLEQEAHVEPGELAVICTSAHTAADYVKQLAPELSRQIRNIEMLPLVTATSFYKLQGEPISGFGCLFPRDQGFRALGVLLNTCIFEGRGPAHSETWIFGGALDRDVLKLDDSELQLLIADERQRLYRRHDEAVSIHITRWPEALPHYSLELEQILRTLAPMPSEAMLVGNYLGRIGLSGIIERAAQVAARFRNKV